MIMQKRWYDDDEDHLAHLRPSLRVRPERVHIVRDLNNKQMNESSNE